MIVKDEDNLRTDFRKLLYDLSKSPDTWQGVSDKKKRSDFYQELERLYWDNGFQHYTFDIFVVLKDLQQDKNNKEGSIEILNHNLELLRQGYQPQNTTADGTPKNVYTQIRKLYNETCIIGASILADAADIWMNSQEAKLTRQENEIELINEKANKSQIKLNLIEEKMKASQKEYIAILGIFAAIILAFTGGITFSTSVLENFHKSSIYRTVFVILLIGFTLVNILYLLFLFIDKLTRTEKCVISAKPVIIFDTIIVTFAIILYALWYTGAVEKRNHNINASTSENISSSLETSETSSDNNSSLAFESSVENSSVY